MSKISKHIHRADAMADHRHELEDGSFTGGALHKPSKDQFDMHSHLYEFEEDTFETSVMHDVPGHVHETRMGESSAASSMPKKPGEPWQKMDSLTREGRMLILRSSTGAVISRGLDVQSVMEHYDSVEDEASVKASIGDVNEAAWEKAKKASIASVGKTKWPLVEHIYKQMI